jgi:hypothetical protein
MLAHVPMFSDLLIAILMVAAYLVGCRWIERRQPTELMGLSAFAEFAGGAGFGLALFSFVMVLLWTIGVFHPTGWGSTGEMGVGAFFAFLYAIVAEILICGLFFRVTATLMGTWTAAILTSVLFGIGSGFNPGLRSGARLPLGWKDWFSWHHMPPPDGFGSRLVFMPDGTLPKVPYSNCPSREAVQKRP